MANETVNVHVDRGKRQMIEPISKHWKNVQVEEFVVAQRQQCIGYEWYNRLYIHVMIQI